MAHRLIPPLLFFSLRLVFGSFLSLLLRFVLFFGADFLSSGYLIGRFSECDCLEVVGCCSSALDELALAAEVAAVSVDVDVITLGIRNNSKVALPCVVSFSVHYDDRSYCIVTKQLIICDLDDVFLDRQISVFCSCLP